VLPCPLYHCRGGADGKHIDKFKKYIIVNFRFMAQFGNCFVGCFKENDSNRLEWVESIFVDGTYEEAKDFFATYEKVSGWELIRVYREIII